MSLFEVESYVLLGHLQAAINAAQALKIQDPSARLQRDVLLYRAYIEQGDSQLVADEIRDDASPALQALKLLALFVRGSLPVDDVFSKAQDLATKSASDSQLQLTVGILFIRMGKLEDALRALHSCPLLES